VQTDPTGTGVIVRTVVLNTPAANAGIRQGDQIVQVAGLPVTTETFRPIVQAAPTPTKIQIVRNGQTTDIEVRLDGTPRRIGIAWRTDAAEPGTMTLTRVIPGSSAAVGGLKVGDRLYALNGEPTTTDENFMADIKDQTELRFDVERKGRLTSVIVKPPPQMAP
jgi:C-terminal processing protease CtpA/Prc